MPGLAWPGLARVLARGRCGTGQGRYDGAWLDSGGSVSPTAARIPHTEAVSSVTGQSLIIDGGQLFG